MEESRALVGFVLLVGSVFSARYAHALAKWDERLGLTGSTQRWDEAEPATWKVGLVLLGALFGFATGGFLFASALV